VKRLSEDVHPAIAAPLEALDEVRVRWCLLRGAEDLHHLDGDVDLLVHRLDLPTVRRLLARMGFAELRARGRRPHRFFCLYVAGQDAWLKLDIVTELAFGPRQELRSRSAEAVLARRVQDGVLAQPAPADAFWTLLLHALLDRGEVRPVHARELEALAVPARAYEAPLAALVNAACPAGWNAARVVETAAVGRFEELLALAPALRAGWPGAPRVAVASRVLLRGVLRRADRWQRRAWPDNQHRGRMTSKSRSRSAG
jgi:hypothetical protein